MAMTAMARSPPRSPVPPPLNLRLAFREEIAYPVEDLLQVDLRLASSGWLLHSFPRGSKDRLRSLAASRILSRFSLVRYAEESQFSQFR